MILVLLSVLAMAADSCPVGNLKDCQLYLQKEHAKKDDASFVQKYNEVCGENKTFSCVKVTVRDDVDAIMKEQSSLRGPKAALYKVSDGSENFIYVLAPKTK